MNIQIANLESATKTMAQPGDKVQGEDHNGKFTGALLGIAKAFDHKGEFVRNIAEVLTANDRQKLVIRTTKTWIPTGDSLSGLELTAMRFNGYRETVEGYLRHKDAPARSYVILPPPVQPIEGLKPVNFNLG